MRNVDSIAWITSTTSEFNNTRVPFFPPLIDQSYFLTISHFKPSTVSFE